MGKDRVVIVVIITVIFSAILFGIFMAYRAYRAPLYVENIDEAIIMLNKIPNDEYDRMIKLSMFYDLSRSYIMKDRKTNKIRKFTKTEMDQIYENIGGKEAVINYLRNIEDDKIRRKELEFARYQLKIITEDELLELW